ncbi:MAG: hypothetical protein GY866_34845 [Proteobacteria bacterium]|nr:hypothetical protein [Pseudomonadota bacterium]
MKKAIPIYIGEYGMDPGYTDQELHDAYASLVRCQEEEDLLQEEMSLAEFDHFYNPGEASFVIEEAISFKSYAGLKKGLINIAKKFEEALSGTDIVLTSHTQPADLKPRKNKLFAYVAAQYNFSDGQSIKILFHSPGGESRSFDKDDTAVSYAHSLNGRDVTHLFAEREGLTTPKFAKRMMQILVKNSDKFLSRRKDLQEKRDQLEAQLKENDDLEIKVGGMEDKIKVQQLGNDGLRERVTNLQDRIHAAEVRNAEMRDQIATMKSEREAQMKKESEASTPKESPPEADPTAGTEGGKDIPTRVSELTGVSSGTFANLTGIKSYEDQESLKQQWHEWLTSELESGKEYSKWQDAWTAFAGALEEDTEEEETGIWSKSVSEVQTMETDQFQTEMEALVDENQHAESTVLLAKYIGDESDVLEAESLHAQQNEAGELTSQLKAQWEPLTDRLRRKLAESQGEPADEPSGEPSEPSEPVGAVAIANTILAGDFDDDPAELEKKFEDILDMLEGNDDDLLDKVSDHYTEVLSQLATA